MEPERPRSIRLIAKFLTCWGLVWIEGLIVWHLADEPLEGRCGAFPPWQTEHTLVVVVTVLGVVIPWWLRRSGPAFVTLTQGRPLGGVDAAIHAVPVIAAGTVLWLASMSLLEAGGGCCSPGMEHPLPWWAGWHYFAAFALAVVLARTGAGR